MQAARGGTARLRRTPPRDRKGRRKGSERESRGAGRTGRGERERRHRRRRGKGEEEAGRTGRSAAGRGRTAKAVQGPQQSRTGESGSGAVSHHGRPSLSTKSKTPRVPEIPTREIRRGDFPNPHSFPNPTARLRAETTGSCAVRVHAVPPAPRCHDSALDQEQQQRESHTFCTSTVQKVTERSAGKKDVGSSVQHVRSCINLLRCFQRYRCSDSCSAAVELER